MIFRNIALASALAVAAFSQGVSAQQDANWWPLKAVDPTGEAGPVVVDYVPLEKASEPYRICALFPHLKDSIWLALNYGLADEAKRLGVNMNLFEAGGYENLPRQIAQFDDCLVGKYDAIVLGAISEGGLAQKMKEAEAAGIPVVAVLNVIEEAPVAGRVSTDIPVITKAAAAYIAEQLDGKPGKVVTFTGPAGSGWAEQLSDGLKADAENYDNIEVVGARYGDTSVATQLSLIQDALLAYPEMNVIFGSASAIEAAEAAVATSGRDDVILFPASENNTVHAMVKSGAIGGFVTQYPVAQARIAMDMAVRAIEDKLELPFVYPELSIISTEEIQTLNMTRAIAPPLDFSAVYSVEVR